MLAVEAGRRTEKVTSLTEGLKGFGKSWNIKLNDDGTVDVWSFSEENGPLIRCTPDGKFILHDVTGYGGCVHEEGSFSTLAEAMMEGETFT